MNKIKTIPKNIGDFLYYDETSPTGLRWKINKSPSAQADRIAGCVSKFSNTLQFEKQFYPCARIVWFLNYTQDPGTFVLDHIDGNRLNNNINNLRLVSLKLNARNKKLHSKNTSGINGIGFSIKRNNTYTHATYRDIEGKAKIKRFSVKKLGLLPAFAAAVDWREQKIKELNEQGAGYTERHGK